MCGSPVFLERRGASRKVYHCAEQQHWNGMCWDDGAPNWGRFSHEFDGVGSSVEQQKHADHLSLKHNPGAQP